LTVAVLGESLIDLIAGEDGAYRPHPGGSPYNVAIGLARQDMEVCYVSPFSDDAFGDRLRDSLLREGVRLPDIGRSRRPTSLALVTVDESGGAAYRLYREGIADKDISREEVVAALPDDAEVFHTGSLAITPSQLPMVRSLLEYMRERGVVVSIDINIRLGASLDTGAYLDGVRSLFPLADIVKASDEDLNALSDTRNPAESARRVFDEMGSGMLVLTRGRAGATLYTSGGLVDREAWPVERVADTVGAGDSFHSAFLAALSRRDAIRGPYEEADPAALGEALEFASAAAAINVTRTGCSPPTRKEVEDLIRSAG